MVEKTLDRVYHISRQMQYWKGDVIDDDGQEKVHNRAFKATLALILLRNTVTDEISKCIQ